LRLLRHEKEDSRTRCPGRGTAPWIDQPRTISRDCAYASPRSFYG